MTSSSSLGEWPFVRLDDVAIRGSGHTPSKRRTEYWGGHIPWVSLGDTKRLDRGLISSTFASATEAGIANSAAVVHPAGTVILLRGSSVGKSAVLGRAMAVSQDYVTWTCGPGLNNWFLYQLLQHWKPEFARLGFGNTVKTIGLDYFHHLEIPLPTISEQRRIAEYLNDADRAIEALERLAAKKSALMQGMMRELLTGKTRLPGFHGVWAAVRVSELLDFKNGLNKAGEFFGSGSPIVNFMDVMRSPVISRDNVSGLVAVDRSEIKRFSALRGDVFFTRTSESVEEVGTAAVLVEDIPDAVFSGFLLRGRPKVDVIDTTFLARQFQLAQVRQQVAATASYTTRALTNGTSLGRIEVLVPSREEQGAIVDVLAAADAEIAAIEQRLLTTRAIKHGMMQELLTGRTRLSVGEEPE